MSIIKQLIPLSLRKKVRNFVLAGDAVYCPCCKMSFLTFLPGGPPYRSHALCPNCHSFERYRLLLLFMQSQPEFFSTKGLKVLHVAPESLFYIKFKAMYGLDYTPIDKFTPDYSYPADTLNMDITDLKLPDNAYDLILCNHVLEHIPNDALAMRNLYRVLKPGGMAILQVPIDYNLAHTFEDPSITDPEERVKAYGQFDHVRMYGRDYDQRLKEAGFKVEVNEFVKTFSKEDVFKYGLDKEEMIYIGRK